MAPHRRASENEAPKDLGSTGAAGSAEHLAQEIHFLLEHGIGLAQGLDPTARMQHGRVVSPAEASPDIGKRTAGELAREIHRDLTRARDAPRTASRMQLTQIELVEFGRLFLDLLDGNPAIR